MRAIVYEDMHNFFFPSFWLGWPTFFVKIMVYRVSWEIIISRVKHNKMSLVQMDCVELQCMHYLSLRSLSAGQNRTRETEVGWPYLRQLKNADMRGWGMPLPLVSTNGMQKILVMNNLNFISMQCMHTTKYRAC